MKNSNNNRKDIFQDQLKNFKALLKGSQMAQLSTVVLAVFSIVTAIKFRSNLEYAIPLLIGAIALVIYLIKFLQLSNIKQKSYTQTSLNYSVLKFKEYLLNRKKYEMPIMAFYLITLLPFILREESILIIIIATILAIALISYLGNLAFKKVASNIELLEITLKNELV